MSARKVIVLVLRLVLGAVWIYAAYTKLKVSHLIFAMSISAYQILPDWASEAVSVGLPWVELAIGILLITGIWLRWISTIGAVLLSGFLIAMGVASARGLGIDCGCFGVGEAISKWTLMRDGSLVAASIALAWLAWLAWRRESHR